LPEVPFIVWSSPRAEPANGVFLEDAGDCRVGERPCVRLDRWRDHRGGSRLG